MPGVDTLALMRALVDCRPQPAVLVLSAFADGPSARKAMAAGAVGWVLKDAEPDELFAALLGAAAFHGAPARHDGETGTAPPPTPALPAAAVRPGFEVTTPLEARTLWALLRALEGDPEGLTVEALASRAIVTVPVAARYIRRVAARHPALAAVAGMDVDGPRYVLTAAGHHELARLEGRSPAAGPSAPARLLR